MRNPVIKIWPFWNKEKWHNIIIIINTIIINTIIVIIIIIIIIIIIVISFFKVDFYLTIYNYKESIDVSLQQKLEKKVGTKRCAINQLTILFLS